MPSRELSRLRPGVSNRPPRRVRHCCHHCRDTRQERSRKDCDDRDDNEQFESDEKSSEIKHAGRLGNRVPLCVAVRVFPKCNPFRVDLRTSL